MRNFAERMEPGSPSYVAIVRHPIHPMLVTFPIAFFISAPASDLAWLWFGDDFWARMSLWLTGAGAITATIAGVSGAVELLVVRRIRMRIPAWDHFVLAVMLISVGFANWGYRIADPAAAIWPWGLYLSLLGFLLVAGAGWLGGALVFEHELGTKNHEVDDEA